MNQIERDYMDLIQAIFEDKKQYMDKSDRKKQKCWTITLYGFIR